MTDKPPTSDDELATRISLNNRIEGFGLEVVNIAPCPFCGAPDFQRWPIMDMDRALRDAATCEACGRSAQTIVTRTHGGASSTFEMVQTGGPDPEPWQSWRPRRTDR